MHLHDVIPEGICAAFGESFIETVAPLDGGVGSDLQSGDSVEGAKRCEGIDGFKNSSIPHVGSTDTSIAHAIKHALQILMCICALVVRAYKKSGGGAGHPQHQNQGGHYGCLGFADDVLHEAHCRSLFNCSLKCLHLGLKTAAKICQDFLLSKKKAIYNINCLPNRQKWRIIESRISKRGLIHARRRYI